MGINSSAIRDDDSAVAGARVAVLPDPTSETQEPKQHSRDNLDKLARSSQREVGDHLNRFLLCTLVNRSAKTIKARAEKVGERLPMAIIVRGVLKSYRLAAKDPSGPLASSEPDMVALRKLN